MSSPASTRHQGEGNAAHQPAQGSPAAGKAGHKEANGRQHASADLRRNVAVLEVDSGDRPGGNLHHKHEGPGSQEEELAAQPAQKIHSALHIPHLIEGTEGNTERNIVPWTPRKAGSETGGKRT